MEIIKADYNYIPVGECICPNCNSQLRYTQKDLVYNNWGDVHINCPICGYEINDIDTPEIKKEFCKEDLI